MRIQSRIQSIPMPSPMRFRLTLRRIRGRFFSVTAFLIFISYIFEIRMCVISWLLIMYVCTWVKKETVKIEMGGGSAI